MHLKDAKVGDAIAYGSYGHCERVARVTKIMKTQVSVEGGKRFMIDTGRMVGSSGWSSVYGRLANEDDIAKIQMKERIDVAQARLRLFTVTGENVGAVEALFKYVR